jgi:hypothetical protein
MTTTPEATAGFPYKPGELVIAPYTGTHPQTVDILFAADGPGVRADRWAGGTAGDKAAAFFARAVTDYARVVAENARLRAALERANAVPLVVTVAPDVAHYRGLLAEVVADHASYREVASARRKALLDRIDAALTPKEG